MRASQPGLSLVSASLRLPSPLAPLRCPCLQAYSELAARCMLASASERPTFSSLVAALQELLERRGDLQAEADAAATAAAAATSAGAVTAAAPNTAAAPAATAAASG